jgi:spermidine/putrescine transport system substrate-binding protein
MATTRRQFIGKTAGIGVLLGAGVPLLQACGGDDSAAPTATTGGNPGTNAPGTTSGSPGTTGGSPGTSAPGTTAPEVTTAPTTGREVTQTIADGLEPEGGPLRIFNYADYINPDMIAAFEELHGTKIEVTTFDVDAEAITKLANGSVEVDVFNSAAPNTLGRLIAGGLLQPLNFSYLPNFSNVLDSFVDPWYDSGSRYTVPYTVFSSGIAYRTDRIDKAKVDEMGWDIIWDPAYKGVTSILDDYREGIAMALLRRGNKDVNTTDEAAIKQAGDDLKELVGLMNIKVNIEAYKDIPEGATDLAHTWSGDMLAGAYSYLPEGTDPSVLGWWYPADGVGVVNNDCMTVTASAKSPVLAHLWINFLLDSANAEENFAWNGYLPPIKGLDADYLIANEYAPENLRGAILTDEIIAKGLRYEPLPLETDRLWEQTWSSFTAG